MRIVPVLDLKGGVVVHARRGDRTQYRPLCSPLVDGCQPLAVARALRDASRSETLYVADLDALAGGPIDVATLSALADVGSLWVDAGATSVERALVLERAGAARNVLGTESLTDRDGPASGPRRVLSIDVCAGRVISPLPELAGRDPLVATRLARGLGVGELLVIDLALVGSRGGPALEAVAQLAAALPGVDVYAGGGVRDDDDLRALERAGAAGALVATALHERALTAFL